MNIEQIYKVLESLQDEIGKINESAAKLDESIQSMEAELDLSHTEEQEEIEAISKKWSDKRAELTKGILEAKQKKQFIEEGSRSLKASVELNNQLFQRLNASLPSADVKDAVDILRQKFHDSNFESKDIGDMQDSDFDELEEQLGIKYEPVDDTNAEETPPDEAA